LAAFYLWSVAAALAADPSPSGAACEVARGYILMDDQDLVSGTQRIRWLPIPVTECVWSKGSRDVWSIFHLLGIPVALCVAGAAALEFAAMRERRLASAWSSCSSRPMRDEALLVLPGPDDADIRPNVAATRWHGRSAVARRWVASWSGRLAAWPPSPTAPRSSFGVLVARSG